MSPLERLRDAIQAVINAEGESEGWALTQFVVIMGLERIDSRGEVEATAWYFTPRDQAEWMTTGLLETGLEMRACSDLDD